MPARAVGAGLLYNISANTGVNLALRAIGVGPGNSPAVFNNLVTTIGEAVSSVTAPLAQLLITGSSGNFRSFLSADFLSWVLSWLFDSGTLTSGLSVPADVPANVSSWLATAENYKYSFFLITSSEYIVGYNNSSPYIAGPVGSSGPGIVTVSGASFHYCSSASNTCGYSSYIIRDVSNVQFFGTAVGDTISTSDDLTLDSVGDSLDAAPYTDWVANSVTHDSESFAPVSVPSLDPADISAQAQGSAQTGTIPDTVVDEIIAGEDVVPDTGTIADVITSIRALGADIVSAVQAIPAAIADIFSPAADPEVYQVDLKDFFPFCIPFDLFDIVTAFAAEPEAPVFEWPISVPRWGFEYTLKVDLQEWEDIASLFRTLELTIFCVGLAIVTREKFLRS